MKSCFQNCKSGDIIHFPGNKYLVVKGPSPGLFPEDEYLYVENVENGQRYPVYYSQFGGDRGVQRVVKVK